MKEIEDILKENRPKLTQASITTYRNCLLNVYKSIADFPQDVVNPELFITKQKEVLDYLKDIKFNLRKTILSALLVYTLNCKKPEVIDRYRNLMTNDIAKYNTSIKENRMSEEQKTNWIDWEEVMSVLNSLKKKTNYIWKEANPTNSMLYELQKYIILACYTLIPPRRLQDYTFMKIKNYSNKDDNFYNKKDFVFNKYKTKDVFGSQVLPLPNELRLLLNKWIKKNNNNSDYLFNTEDGTKNLSPSTLTKILNGIFRKKISASMLRHIFITHLEPQINKLKEIATDMGHSTNTQQLYIKNK